MAGKIEVIVGPMRCGKSEEVLRRVKRFLIAELNVLIVKPSTDKRFSEDEVVSRDDRKADCIVIPANNPEYIMSLVDESTDVIVIDEVQFFSKKRYYCSEETCGTPYGINQCLKCEHLRSDRSITDVVQELSDRGYRVIVAGLDMTAERKPFNEIPYLMAIADDVTKLKSICESCKKEDGIYSYANFKKDGDIAVGDSEYNVLCRKCYLKKMKK